MPKNKVVTKAIERLPVLLPVAVAAFSVVAMVLLLIGRLDGWLVWPLGILAAVFGCVIVWRTKLADRVGGRREQVICDILIIAGAIAWGLFNATYSSEHLFTNRDPATYANAGIWLIDHSSIEISTPSVFGAEASITNESPGFLSPKDNDEVVHAQGQHLLPVMIGLGGRIVGQDWALKLPPLIASLALLAFYGFVRLIVKPWWALAATATLSAALPFIYFSRDSYTEPLVIMFVFGGLALLWQACMTKNVWLWFLAGLVAGAATLLRVDAYITLAGFAAAVITYLAVAKKSDRFEMLRRSTLFVGGAAVSATIAWLDLTLLSVPYFVSHKELVVQELIGLAVLVVVGVVGILIAWRSGVVVWLDRLTKLWRSPFVVGLVAALVVVVATRPLWGVAGNKSGLVTDYIASLQIAEGLPVEPRSYAEYSAYWISWYLGPLLTILGATGLAITVSRVVRKSGYLLVALVTVFLANALLYLFQPNIAPDQIWAIRRFLPVVIPSLIIFGYMAIQSAGNNMPVGRLVKNTFVSLVAIAVLAGPLAVSAPFVFTRDTDQEPLFAGLCSSLPERAAVIWLGEGQYYNVQATRSFCKVPTVAYVPFNIDKAELGGAALEATKNGYVPVVAVFAGDKHLTGKPNNLKLVSSHTYKEMELRLTSAPKNVVEKSYEFMIAKLGANGEAEPL